jgi:hypothetical protein
LVAIGVLAVAFGPLLARLVLADSRDGPIFINTATQGRQDVGEVYVFRSPLNPANTVFVATISPFAGNVTPSSFDASLFFDIRIDTTGDGIEDLTFRTSFSAPDGNNVQDVKLRVIPSLGFQTPVIASGRTGGSSPTGQDIPIVGGGTFRAGVHDNPFFFDQGAFETLETTGAGFPRAPGTAHNFYGPNGDTLAIIIEIPSARFRFPASNPNKIMGVWARSERDGTQLDREARPIINAALIPPSPRSHLTRGERRNAFNAALPRDDRTNFRNDMIFVLTDPTGIFKRTSGEAGFLADAVLPDMLMFQIGNPGGFGTLVGGAGSPGFFGSGPFAGGQVLGNGRRLNDDVVDIMFNLFTNGAIPGDNVGDDNGLKVTDGSVDPVSLQTRAKVFPYIGLANLPFNGAGTGPNP